MPDVKIGSRLKSAVCETQIIIIKSPLSPQTLTCGGVAMVGPAETAGGDLDPSQAGGTLTGKRYVNADESLEVLCVKGGDGSLALGGHPLHPKEAKALPSSD